MSICSVPRKGFSFGEFENRVSFVFVLVFFLLAVVQVHGVERVPVCGAGSVAERLAGVHSRERPGGQGLPPHLRGGRGDH